MPTEVEWYGSPDDPPHIRVDFDKIHRTLGFAPDHTLKNGTQGIYEALKDGKVADSKKQEPLSGASTC